MDNFNNWLMRCLAGALLVLGLSGNAVADNCESFNATFTGSIGSQTSCADHNMTGCSVGAGGTECTYRGSICDFKVMVNPAVGDSADDTTSFTVTNPGFGKPTCQLKMSITQGNTGSNYCYGIYPGGVVSDTLTTHNNKGDSVPHKNLDVCTDELYASEPRVGIEKTVVRAVQDPVTGLFTINCNDATEELDVIAPTHVAYCYSITNTGQGAIENLAIVDDMGTPLDASDDLTLLNDGTGLASGATLVVSTAEIMITEAGNLVNTATVAGDYQGGQCSGCSDSDTATVNIVVECDSTTQSVANTTGTVVEARDADGTTRCGPAADNSPQSNRSVSLLCDGSCDLKDECKDSPISCKQPCKPSGNWTMYDETSGQCTPASPKPGKLPLCQEVLGNPNNNSDCSVIHNPAPIRSDGHSHLYSSNPLLYYFPSSSGGGSNTTGTIYCILYPGEDASVCPAGSFVY